MTVGGVDTYYDYDEQQWKSRRLGGGPIHRGPVCPAPGAADHASGERTVLGRDHGARDHIGSRERDESASERTPV